MKTYRIHPLAGIVALADEAEQTALTEDIRANGLQDTIVLWNGEVVDGRCRLKAWQIIGLEALIEINHAKGSDAANSPCAAPAKQSRRRWAELPKPARRGRLCLR